MNIILLTSFYSFQIDVFRCVFEHDYLLLNQIFMMQHNQWIHTVLYPFWFSYVLVIRGKKKRKRRQRYKVQGQKKNMLLKWSWVSSTLKYSPLSSLVVRVENWKSVLAAWCVRTVKKRGFAGFLCCVLCFSVRCEGVICQITWVVQLPTQWLIRQIIQCNDIGWMIKRLWLNYKNNIINYYLFLFWFI